MCFPKFWTPNHHALVEIFPMDVPMISLDVSQAFYHLYLNPASAIQLLFLAENWSTIFRKLQ